MNTLILIPLAGKYINPDEIAVIEPWQTGDSRCCGIRLRGNPTLIQIDMPLQDVLTRLEKHLDSGVVKLATAAQYLAGAVRSVCDLKSDTQPANHWRKLIEDVTQAINDLGLSGEFDTATESLLAEFREKRDAVLSGTESITPQLTALAETIASRGKELRLIMDIEMAKLSTKH